MNSKEGLLSSEDCSLNRKMVFWLAKRILVFDIRRCIGNPDEMKDEITFMCMNIKVSINYENAVCGYMENGTCGGYMGSGTDEVKRIHIR